VGAGEGCSSAPTDDLASVAHRLIIQAAHKKMHIRARVSVATTVLVMFAALFGILHSGVRHGTESWVSEAFS